MTNDGIASLVTAILALLLSLINFYFLLKSKKIESKSSFRRQFFVEIIKNQNLLSLAKSINSAIEKKEINNFAEIHSFSVNYSNDIRYLSLVQPRLYRKMAEFIEKIDDSAILCAQRISDKKEFNNLIKDIIDNLKLMYSKLEVYYQGKQF